MCPFCRTNSNVFGRSDDREASVSSGDESSDGSLVEDIFGPTREERQEYAQVRRMGIIQPIRVFATLLERNIARTMERYHVAFQHRQIAAQEFHAVSALEAQNIERVRLANVALADAVEVMRLSIIERARAQNAEIRACAALVRVQDELRRLQE